MNTYQVVDCRGIKRSIEADFFEYAETLRAIFYIDKDPNSPCEMICAFINPASIVKMENKSDE